MTSSQNILLEFFAKRTSLAELILVAVVLSAGVELAIQPLSDSLKWGQTTSIVVGLGLILFATAFFTFRVARSVGGVKELSGFFVLGEEGEAPISISRYEYSERLNEYFRSAIAENPALKREWKTKDLGFVEHLPDSSCNSDIKAAAQLVREATEYFVISSLSTHLTDYFANQKGGLQTLSREHVPDVLLKNRFLELFSKNPKGREIFPEEFNDGLEPEGAVVMMSTAEGGLFQHFDLVLPKGSKVNRLHKSRIEIATPRIRLKISVDFEGFGFTLPSGFRAHYMGEPDFFKNRAFQIDIKVEGAVRPRALILGGGWKYYAWIDSFLQSLAKDFHADTFFEDIAWEASATLLECQEKKSVTVEA